MLMALMMSLREVAPDKLMSPECPERSVMEIVPSGIARSAIEGSHQNRIKPRDEGAPWIVLPVAVVRPRSDAASEPF